MTYNPNRDTLFATLAGSHAHGTAGPESDIDIRGVCALPILTRLSLFHAFEQVEGELPPELLALLEPQLRVHSSVRDKLTVKQEGSVFELAKFLRLLCNANPNALEILFADPADHLFVSPVWNLLYDCRHRFLTKKVAHTYVGYGLAQLRRIDTHRSWLLHPLKEMPTRAQFGLPDASTLSQDDRERLEHAIAEAIRCYNLDSIEMPDALRIALNDRLRAFHRDHLFASATPDEGELNEQIRATAIKGLQLPGHIVALLQKERSYRGALKHWDSYVAWKSQRNPARARLEAQYGYDTKHAGHLIRLLESGLEILKTGDLRVRRRNFAELRAVRDGALTFEALTSRAKQLEGELRAALQTTTLPNDIGVNGNDPVWVDEIFIEMLQAHKGR